MTQQVRGVSDVELDRFERLNDLVLPESYRRFLLTHNGGRPIAGEFPVPGWGVTVVDFFFGIGTRDSYDMQRHFDRLENPRGSELLPVASDPGGWIIYLAVRGDHQGSVYFWDHKEPGSHPILIGDDFESFLGILRADGTYDDHEFGYPPNPLVDDA